MENKRSKQFTITGTLSTSFALFTALAVLWLTYFFCVGVVEAASLDGRMPAWLSPMAKIYSLPATLAVNLPAVQLPARFAIDLGYNLADGPETTR